MGAADKALTSDQTGPPYFGKRNQGFHGPDHRVLRRSPGSGTGLDERVKPGKSR